MRRVLGAAPLTTDSLGAALRTLREASGLTGDVVARRASMSAGKLSKIENNKVRPTLQDVDLILSALSISAEAKEQFLDTTRAEATEATAWRLLRRMGPWKHQNTIKAIETSTTVLRLFQGQLVPGLLQTPEYASAVFSVPPVLPEETRGRTVAARIERQETLHDPQRSFRFLIREHVLRWQVAIIGHPPAAPDGHRFHLARGLAIFPSTHKPSACLIPAASQWPRRRTLSAVALC
ncbi:Scr1 family TA system antitoxin-like transcriptional regulator [Streptomyces sp. NPDC050703]|uniref:Scr1 family TA system antitoxin-like transcriptional regulator n=1 Tax=Streptomyces sp. NPDC050703 TaxID=3157218 RepID=UPI0034277362